MGPDIAPGGAEGKLIVPVTGWNNGDVLQLRFYSGGDILVDEFRIPLNPAEPKVTSASGSTPQIVESDRQLTVTGTDFEFTFSKETGLITDSKYNGRTIIKIVPYLHLQGIKLPEWSRESIRYITESSDAIVTIKGNYGEAK